MISLLIFKMALKISNDYVVYLQTISHMLEKPISS